MLKFFDRFARSGLKPRHALPSEQAMRECLVKLENLIEEHDRLNEDIRRAMSYAVAAEMSGKLAAAERMGTVEQRLQRSEAVLARYEEYHRLPQAYAAFRQSARQVLAHHSAGELLDAVSLMRQQCRPCADEVRHLLTVLTDKLRQSLFERSGKPADGAAAGKGMEQE